MFHLSIDISFGRQSPEPEPDHDSQTDALVDHGPPPEAPPIGFWPTSDPTRRTEG